METKVVTDSRPDWGISVDAGQVVFLDRQTVGCVYSGNAYQDAAHLHTFHNVSYASVKWSEVAQLCPTLCDPMDCSLPGSIHGIFQARILEWNTIYTRVEYHLFLYQEYWRRIPISFSRGSSPPRDQTRVSHIAGRRFTVWATKAPGNSILFLNIPELFSVW